MSSPREYGARGTRLEELPAVRFQPVPHGNSRRVRPGNRALLMHFYHFAVLQAKETQRKGAQIVEMKLHRSGTASTESTPMKNRFSALRRGELGVQ